MWRYFILGLRPLHNSLDVLGIDSDGTKYKICIVVFSAYPQNEIGTVESLIIDLTISKRVLFLLSTTSFCWGVSGAVNWDTIPF